MKREREKNNRKCGGGQEVYILISGALTDDARLGEVFSRAMIGCAILVRRMYPLLPSSSLFYNLKANAPKYSNLSREAQGLKYVIVIEPESLALEV
jgi:hypothetical protein